MTAFLIAAGVTAALVPYLKWGVKPVAIAYEIGVRRERFRQHARSEAGPSEVNLRLTGTGQPEVDR